MISPIEDTIRQIVQSEMAKQHAAAQPATVRLKTIRDAAEYLGLSPRTVREMVDNGVLRKVQSRDVRRVLVDIKDLDKWIEANKD